MIELKKNRIVVCLKATAKTNWREEINKFSSLGITEVALFIDSFLLEQRKEVYRLLEKSDLKSIPYVQISTNFEEGEMDYLATTYGTKIFGLYFDSAAVSFIANLVKFSSSIAPENAKENKFSELFSDETLSKINNLAGVCLNISTLEHDRLHNKKKYKATIHTLDHHAILATKIGPMSENFFNKTFQIRSEHLTTLSDLHYLRNFPRMYLADLVVLNFNNTLEEQLEIKSYLEVMFK